MIYRFLADLTVIVHAAFVAFVILGGFLVLRWRRLMWLHLPAAVWGAYIEYSGRICPLTPLQNEFRSRAGETVYAGGFIDHYLIPVLYPSGLTRNAQWILGTAVVVVNCMIYAVIIRRARRRAAPAHESSRRSRD